jgi:murein L,D-transpeptidase YcbB/YkuD
MFSLGSAAALPRVAAIALAALIAAGSAWGDPAPQADAHTFKATASEATAPAATPSEAATPAPAADATVSDAADPDAANPDAAKPAAVLGTEVLGPDKPSLNSALRAALLRRSGESGRLTPDVRARRQAVDAFYASRGDAPIWLDNGQWTPAARAVFEALQSAPDDGLDLRAYRVYSLDKGKEASLMLGEVALSDAVAAYAFQASGGRIDPKRISGLIGSRPGVIGAAQALDDTSKAADAGAVLKAYNPNHPGYIALREKLAQARAEPQIGPVARLAATESGRRASDAVGSIGRRAAPLESEILVNMEFWRWLPRDLGRDRIMVNVPEFMARLYRSDAVAMETRVIVGKPDKQTPLFSNRMDYLVVNPSWNVPQSIIKNEMASHLDNLRAQGYVISYSQGLLHVRQPPGERNALGKIKFIFPNDYSVYMHDTPNHGLFQASVRAFSHGCVRVDQPFKFAEAVLGPEHGWSEARIKKLVGKSEREVRLPEPLPIHIGYFTMGQDEFGDWRRFDDIYGYAGKTRQMLGLGG